MRESRFIETNKKKWLRFEQMLDKKDNDPDELSSLFIEINEDSSYANTFYRNRLISKYLNKLSAKLFNKIFGRLKREKGFIFFWKEELPYIAHTCRREIYFCTILLVATILLGVISSYASPDFARSILGDSYIAMTEENIASGDPMAVYKSSKGSDMMLGITLNNIRVSFLSFIMGLIGGIGSLVILVHNGVMVGAFQYFFIERGLFVESFLTIWMHGAIEVSLIAIETAAGLVLGKGLIMPGSLPRVTAFKQSAKRAVKLLLGTTPLIVLAATIESFVTRFTELPDIFRALFILISFALVGYIFFIYPRRVAKRGFHEDVIKEDFSPSVSFRKSQEPKAHLLNNVEVFSKALQTIGKKGSKLYYPIFIFPLLAAGSITYWKFFSDNVRSYASYNDWGNAIAEVFLWAGYSFDLEVSPEQYIVNVLLLTATVIFTRKIWKKRLFKSFSSIVVPLVVCALLVLLVSVAWWGVLLSLFIIPLPFALLSRQNFSEGSLSDHFNYTRKFAAARFGKYWFIFISFALLFLFATFFVNGLFFYLMHSLVSPYLFTDYFYAEVFNYWLSQYLLYVFTTTLVVCLITAYQILSNTVEEIMTASVLAKRIQKL